MSDTPRTDALVAEGWSDGPWTNKHRQLERAEVLLQANPSRREEGRGDMSDIKRGDYVLATKYNDGDPGDNWCVGFYDRTDDGGRHYVTDAAGNQFRGNGFRRAEKINTDVGAWLLSNAKAWEEALAVKSVWDYRRERESADAIEQLQRELAEARAERDKLRKIIHGLAEQQAMPDDWWKGELAAIDAAKGEKP